MASRFWVGGTGTWDAVTTTNWSATTGGAGGASVPIITDDVTLDAASGGGVITVNTNFSVNSITMGTFTGTLDFSANNNSPIIAVFTYSGTGVRTINLGSGTWSITGSNTQVWVGSVTTNLTLTGTATINFTYSGSVGTRSISTGNIQLTTSSFNVVAGSDIFNSTNGTAQYYTLNFTGFTGTFNNGSTVAMNVINSLILGTGMTNSYTNTINFTGTSGTGTISSNGVAFSGAVTVNGVGGTWQLGSDLLMGTNVLTLTNGSFNANNFNVSCGSFSSSNANTRTVSMGNKVWSLSGTGTVWNTATITGLTIVPSTSTVRINDASASSKTFSSGTETFAKLTLTGGGTGTMILGTAASTLTFTTIQVDHPLTIQVFAASTIIATQLLWTGTAGSLNTFQSTTNGIAWTISVATGIMSENYISLQDSTASGGATFYAGANSTNVSGNTGWLFSQAPGVGGGNPPGALANLSNLNYLGFNTII